MPSPATAPKTCSHKSMHKVSVQQAVPFNLGYTFESDCKCTNPIEQYIQGIDPQDGSITNWTITKIELSLKVLQRFVCLFV